MHLFFTHLDILAQIFSKIVKIFQIFEEFYAQFWAQFQTGTPLESENKLQFWPQNHFLKSKIKSFTSF